MNSYVILLLTFALCYNLCDGTAITKVHIVTNQAIKGGEVSRVAFDSFVFDSEHHYHRDESYIDIRKEAGFRVEGHASLAGAGKHSAEVKIIEDRDGQQTVLATCTTDESGRCNMAANTRLKAGEIIFMQVKPERDAEITNADTYLFLAEKIMDV